MMRGVLLVVLVVAGAWGNEGTRVRGYEGTGERGNDGTGERGNEGTFRRSAVPPFRRSPTPFRLPSRRPVVRYGAAPVAAAVATPPPPRPVLTLTGVLWGAEPAALVRGLPGAAEEVVVHVGERHGGIQVRAIQPHTVELDGMDTTWVLTVRTPW